MRAIFLDRDGVININNKCSGKVEDFFVLDWDQFKFIDGAIVAIRYLSENGWPIFIVTNQNCISRGLTTWNKVVYIHWCMRNRLASEGGAVTEVVTIPKSTNKGESKASAILALAGKYGIDLNGSWMISDSADDIIYANELGLSTIHIDLPYGNDPPDEADIVASCLYDGVVELLDNTES